MKIAVSTVLGLHMLLGNLCMMQMAYAQEMSMPSEAHNESMEMTMTPVVPMTPAHCEHCVKVKNPDANAMGSSMPCSSGHCITHTSPMASATPSSHSFVSIALPNAEIISFPVFREYSHTESTAPPGIPILTDTIVLQF